MTTRLGSCDGGLQRVDGSVEPAIVVHALTDRDPIRTAAQARQLARALMAAADECDRVTEV